MDNMYLQEILVDSVKSQIIVWTLLFVLILLFLALDVLYYVRGKGDNGGFSLWALLPIGKRVKSKLSVKEQIFLKVLGLIILIAVLAWKIMPAYSDISGQQYACCYGEYLRTSESSESTGFFSNGYVSISAEGEKLRLNLPSHWTSAQFPEGAHTGYVWYSEESGYILAFEPG